MLSYASAPEKKHLDPSQTLPSLQSRNKSERTLTKLSSNLPPNLKPLLGRPEGPGRIKAGLCPGEQRNFLPFPLPQEQEGEESREPGLHRQSTDTADTREELLPGTAGTAGKATGSGEGPQSW